ncbi:MAG: pspB [Alphaproteobacteria bacterium]|nr:pspB [Alphaproteobacteria bacterium]
MEAVFIPVAIVGMLFIGLPWLIFHYVTQWKKAATLTGEDEKLLDELNDLARRLDERMCSIERIMTAENPNWRALACDPAAAGLESLATTNQPRRIER